MSQSPFIIRPDEVVSNFYSHTASSADNQWMIDIAVGKNAPGGSLSAIPAPQMVTDGGYTYIDLSHYNSTYDVSWEPSGTARLWRIRRNQRDVDYATAVKNNPGTSMWVSAVGDNDTEYSLEATVSAFETPDSVLYWLINFNQIEVGGLGDTLTAAQLISMDAEIVALRIEIAGRWFSSGSGKCWVTFAGSSTVGATNLSPASHNNTSVQTYQFGGAFPTLSQLLFDPVGFGVHTGSGVSGAILAPYFFQLAGTFNFPDVWWYDPTNDVFILVDALVDPGGAYQRQWYNPNTGDVQYQEASPGDGYTQTERPSTIINIGGAGSFSFGSIASNISTTTTVEMNSSLGASFGVASSISMLEGTGLPINVPGAPGVPLLENPPNSSGDSWGLHRIDIKPRREQTS